MRTRVIAGIALALAIAAGAFALDKPAEPPAAADSGFLTVGKGYNFYTPNNRSNVVGVTLLKQVDGKWAKVRDALRETTIWVRIDSCDKIAEDSNYDAPPAAK